MAAHIGQPTRSRRFIKVYLITWALLAVGALAYLAMLAFPPQASAPSPQASLEPAKSEPEVPKALAEVRSLQGNLSEVRKDVTQLQDAMGERAVNEQVVQSRLTALEERVATIDPPQPATEPLADLTDKTAQREPHTATTADILARAKDAKAKEVKAQDEKGVQAQDEKDVKAQDAKAKGVKILDVKTRDVKTGNLSAPSSAPKASAPPAAPIETGSIASSKAVIIFGKAIVKPAERPDFAVQLAAGRSLQMLRRSWGQLVEQHRGSLASLQPRVVAPRAEGGHYRLLAGPVPTKADADRICEEMRAGPKSCFATRYAGTPL